MSWLIDWRRVLVVVKPDTLIRWHRKGFKLFCQWKSRQRGRPRLPADVRQLIAEMALANRTWGEKDCLRASRKIGHSRITADGTTLYGDE
jgi:putative transposase